MENELPTEVQERIDAYVERIKAIRWFQPTEISKDKINRQVKVALSGFGLSASVEYRDLKTVEDWDAARDAARGAAWDAARDAARGAAWDAAWDAAKDAAWDAAKDAAWDAARDAAWDAAWDAARGAADIVASDLREYAEKYPNGSFINLIPLWEMGLYPAGIVGGKFVIYVPEKKES